MTSSVASAGGDGELRVRNAAIAVTELIRKDVLPSVAIVQRHRIGIGIVERVGVATVRIEPQAAIGAGNGLADAGRPSVHLDDRQRRASVPIAVVGENIAHDSIRRRILGNRSGVIHARRRVIGASDGDGNRRRLRTAHAVAGQIGEAVLAGLAGSEALRIHISIVERIGIGAIGIDLE